jgi:hypothetical protein
MEGYMDLVGDGLDRIQVDQDRTQGRDFTTKLIKKHGTLDHMSNYKLLYYGKTTAAPPFQPDDGSKTQTSERSIFIILQFRA